MRQIVRKLNPRMFDIKCPECSKRILLCTCLTVKPNTHIEDAYETYPPPSLDDWPEFK